MATHKTREAWLMAAVKAMTPWFAEVDGNDIPQVRISVGWSKRAKSNAIGVCWHRECSADETNEILIVPTLDEPVRILDVVLHEMVHASDNGASKHSGYFRKTAVALGLEGKMTATVAGDELRERLTKLASKLGDYPHAALNPSAGTVGKQGTRMIKVACPDESCGYTVRTTMKWIQVGLPTCMCGTEMEVAA